MAKEQNKVQNNYYIWTINAINKITYMTNRAQSLTATSPVPQHKGTQLAVTVRPQTIARAAFYTKQAEQSISFIT
jgi:hypothetical protein